MDKYIFSYDTDVNNEVNEILRTIKNEIVRIANPKSIILRGSFGRNEISVIKTDKGLKFLSDCEIIVIPKRRFKMKDLSKISNDISAKTGLKIEISDIELELKYCLRIRKINRILTTIDNYELKHGSKVIYGINFLDELPDFKAEEISIWEGIRLVFNRLIESMQYFSIDYIDEYPSKEEECELLFWINKIILACQDVLLISSKKYHYSYKKRNEIFQEIFPKQFGALNEEIPNFLPLTMKATGYKLNPNINKYSNDVVALWFEVIQIVDKIFRFVIENEMGITFNSYIEFQSEYLKHSHIHKKYYRGISPHPFYQNVRSFTKMWVYSHNIPLKLLKHYKIPFGHMIYSLIPNLYFNLLNYDKTIFKNNLEHANFCLQNIKNINESEKSDAVEFDLVKNQIFYYWSMLCF